MRVLALVTLPSLGAGNRLRIEQYAPPMTALGIDLVVSPFFDEAAHAVLYRPGHLAAKILGTARGLLRRARDVMRARRYDVVIVYREAVPFGPAVFERALGAFGVPYLYDFDDAIFVQAPYSVNRRWAWLRPTSRVAETTRRAAAVIVGNEYLAEWARRHNPDVTIIPTPVDTDRHVPRSGSRPAGPLVVGWVGSQTTAPYLHLVDRPLAALAARHEVVVRVVGGPYAAAGVPVEDLRYDVDREPADLASFDIGILPEPDDAWTRGKGAFKALLYMATGLPVVASRIGVNADVIVDGVTGFCVNDERGWQESLERLVADPALRARLGAAGRERIERLYSLRVQTPRFAAALERAASRRR